jgi:hypothetical protein
MVAQDVQEVAGYACCDGRNLGKRQADRSLYANPCAHAGPAACLAWSTFHLIYASHGQNIEVHSRREKRVCIHYGQQCQPNSTSEETETGHYIWRLRNEVP